MGDAVQADLRQRGLVAEAERHLAELVDEVGEPSAEEVARSETLSRIIPRAGTA